MNVRELIKELKECHPEAKVYITLGTEERDTFETTDFEVIEKDIKEYITLYHDLGVEK